jgi:hypothetical protein
MLVRSVLCEGCWCGRCSLSVPTLREPDMERDRVRFRHACQSCEGVAEIARRGGVNGACQDTDSEIHRLCRAIFWSSVLLLPIKVKVACLPSQTDGAQNPDCSNICSLQLIPSALRCSTCRTADCTRNTFGTQRGLGVNFADAGIGGRYSECDSAAG